MAKVVRTIPATRQLWTSQPIERVQKRRVAGYARVSTNQEEQETSYEAQLDYYRQYILSHDSWELVDIYADEGISATSTKRREGFNRMISDAMAGRIDLIVTKSVSRFARNTVDSLTIVRELKERGVEVYFEKENIWTLDSKGELLITIMSSLAQEESRSISENTTWGIRKRFADGKASVAYTRFLGYDKDFQINDEQAETVKLIYDLFLDGYNYYGIKAELEKQGRKTAAGKTVWYISSIKSILQNEKYAGHALMQKGFTVDFLQKKHKKNDGELPQQYVEDHHPAIIPPELFEEVQAEIAQRKSNSRIKCGCCGGWYGAKVWHSNDKYRRVVYRCNNRYEGEHPAMPVLSQQDIEDCFTRALEQMVLNRDSYIEDLREMQRIVADTEPLKRQIATARVEIEKLRVEYMHELREEAGADSEGSRVDDIIERHNALVASISEAERQIKENEEKAAAIKRLLATMDGEIAYDSQLWSRTVNHAVVNKDHTMTIIFKGGITASVEL